MQAWHGDRSIEQQDKYLFTARQNVGELLRDIMNYKFHRKLFREESTSSGITIDSGLATGSTGSEPVTACQNETGESFKKYE